MGSEMCIRDRSRRTGAEVFISASPCYGACDLAVDEAERLEVEVLIHYGHTPFKDYGRLRFRVIYVEARSLLKVGEELRETVRSRLSFSRIGLTATVQHVHMLQDVKALLEEEGKTVKVGKPRGFGVAYDGQVLGCNVSAAEAVRDEVEAYLHIGGGIVHPLAIYLATGKPVIGFDPHTGKALDVSSIGEKVRAKLRGSLLKLAETFVVGVIVGLKVGQYNPELAGRVAKVLEGMGKRPHLLCLGEVKPESLENFPWIEAFINTACPCIGLGVEEFGKPLIPAKVFLETFRG